jgi:toxin ParE1/3/4
MTLIWTEGSVEDPEAILDYIANDDPAAARRLGLHLADRLHSLEAMPYLGRKRTDNNREFIFTPWPYLALYEVVGDRIYIKAIRHAARNYR